MSPIEKLSPVQYEKVLKHIGDGKHIVTGEVDVIDDTTGGIASHTRLVDGEPMTVIEKGQFPGEETLLYCGSKLQRELRRKKIIESEEPVGPLDFE